MQELERIASDLRALGLWSPGASSVAVCASGGPRTHGHLGQAVVALYGLAFKSMDDGTHAAFVHSAELSALALRGATPAVCQLGRTAYAALTAADMADLATLGASFQAARSRAPIVLLDRFGALVVAANAGSLLSCAGQLALATRTAVLAGSMAQHDAGGGQSIATEAEVARARVALWQLDGAGDDASCRTCNACPAGALRKPSDPLGGLLVDAVDQALRRP